MPNDRYSSNSGLFIRSIFCLKPAILMKVETAAEKNIDARLTNSVNTVS